MLKSSIAMLISGTLVLLFVVNNVNCVQIGLETFEKLEPCEKKCDNFYSILRANPTDSTNQDLIGCKSGCNILVMEGANTEIGCEEKCRTYTNVDTAVAACVKSCMDFADLKQGPAETVVQKIPLPAIEQPIITEVKKIEDDANKDDAKPAIPIDKVPEDVHLGIKGDSEEKKDDSSSSSEEDKDDDIKIESPIDLFKDFFSSELIRGEPQGSGVNTKDSDAYLGKPKDQTDDVETVGGTFDNLFSYFDKLKDTFKSAIDKGSYMLRVRIFSNGTVVKEYNELPDGQLPDSIFDSIASGSNIGDEDDNEQPKIIHLQDPFNINDRDSINWKGRPLLIGQPIAVPNGPSDMSDDMLPPYHRFRECRPISFRLSTLCHDVNNMFNCASMRTGLPRWFFLTLSLSLSFLMIWLGIFILSMLRRIRKRERIIYHREEYLPLYKDLDFEVEKGELNNSYIVEPEAGPLPPKTQI